MGEVKPGTHLVLSGCLVPCYHEGKDLRRLVSDVCINKEASDNENGQAYLLRLIKEVSKGKSIKCIAIRGLLLQKVEEMAINNRACHRRLGTFLIKSTSLRDSLGIFTNLFGSWDGSDGWPGYRKSEVTII